MIYVCEPVLDGNEAKYVMDCLNANWISSNGDYNRRFEEIMCNYLDMPFAVSASSCTAALHMALVALGIGPGDEVIIPDFTLIVSANTVILAGARPVLADVDPQTWCIDPVSIERAITPHTRAIMVVHMYGHPCNMPAIMDIACKYDLKVIEDCAEAQGAEINGKKAGTFGDINCFSFYGNKIITTGEGGMALCRDPVLAQRLGLLRNQAFQEPRFVHTLVGFNYRMTNLQAAIGLAQMEKVEEKVARKRWIAQAYNERLNCRAELILPFEAPGSKNVYWMYGVLLNGDYQTKRKDRVMNMLHENGIETRSFFCPMHLQPVFQQKSPNYFQQYDQNDFPVSSSLWERGFYLPSGLGMTCSQIDEVCNKLLDCVSKV